MSAKLEAGKSKIEVWLAKKDVGVRADFAWDGGWKWNIGSCLNPNCDLQGDISYAVLRSSGEIWVGCTGCRATVVEIGKDAPRGDGGKTSAAGKTEELAAAIQASDSFALDEGGKLYHYEDGVYKPNGEAAVRRRVKELLAASGEAWTSHRSKEVQEYLSIGVPKLWERPPLETLNVRNGLLNVLTRDLRPHDPGFLSPVQLPITFDPTAICANSERFIETTFPEDTRQLPYEVLAWLMTPDTSIQKAILATGEGSNGKSVWLAQLQAFLGRPNVAAKSLQKISEDRFCTAALVGKLANICPDLPSMHLADTSVFKAITGGDSITAEYKFKPSFDFKPFSRLVFSANHPPRSADASYAFFRRWLVVPFTRTFEEGAEGTIPREELDARLSSAAELSGLLNRALEALPRIRSAGITESPTMKAAWDEFRETTDPLAVWLDRATVSGPEVVVPKDGLQKAYAKDCEASNRPWPTKNAFGRALKRLRPDLAEAQRMVGGDLAWVWVGIGLRLSDEALETTDNGSHHSRNSRDSSYSKTNRATPFGEHENEENGRQKQVRDISVNSVNGVNAAEEEDPFLEQSCERGYLPN